LCFQKKNIEKYNSEYLRRRIHFCPLILIGPPIRMGLPGRSFFSVEESGNGPMGQLGSPGNRGDSGPMGIVGDEGPPGVDRDYCPCPGRGILHQRGVGRAMGVPIRIGGPIKIKGQK